LTLTEVFNQDIAGLKLLKRLQYFTYCSCGNGWWSTLFSAFLTSRKSDLRPLLLTLQMPILHCTQRSHQKVF